MFCIYINQERMISCINLVELNISTRISIYSCYHCYRHKDTKFFNKICEINTLTVSTIFLGKKIKKRKERKKERKTDFMIFACLIDEEVQEETVEVLICLFQQTQVVHVELVVSVSENKTNKSLTTFCLPLAKNILTLPFYFNEIHSFCITRIVYHRVSSLVYHHNPTLTKTKKKRKKRKKERKNSD